MKKFLFICIMLNMIWLTANAQYKIERYVLGAGGGSSLNPSNQIKGTFGQQFSGNSMSTLNRINVGFWYSYSQLTGIEQKNILPHAYMLYQNYPNPFNPVTRFKYELPEESLVSLKIYNALGQELAVLINSTQKAGIYEVDWNAAKYASGIYICRIEAGKYISVKKMILLK